MTGGRLPRPSRAATALSGELNRVAAILLGLAAVGLAVSAWLRSEPAGVLAHQAVAVLGWTFPSLLVILVAAGLLAVLRLARGDHRSATRQLGLQSAACIATLALTCTLFGISLGVASLADRPLSPATVPTVIGDLTRRFGTAFMTTVIGLPVSAVLRAAVLILAARQEDRRSR